MATNHHQVNPGPQAGGPLGQDCTGRWGRAARVLRTLAIFVGLAAGFGLGMAGTVWAAPPAGRGGKGMDPGPPPGGDGSLQAVTGIGVALTGDTLTVAGSAIRLAGIAAPADGQTCQTLHSHEYDCFKLSTEMLQALVGETEVTCTIEASDRTGQKIGRCRVNGVDLGGAMVSRGWAFAYSRLSASYERAEVYAQVHRLGMWGGRVEKPWQWRTRRLREQAR